MPEAGDKYIVLFEGDKRDVLIGVSDIPRLRLPPSKAGLLHAIITADFT